MISIETCETVVPKQNPMSYTGSGHRPKQSVLCGFSYQKHKHKHKGTIIDVSMLKDLLVECFGFSETAICVLTEQEKDPNLTLTKANMQKGPEMACGGLQVWGLLGLLLFQMWLTTS